MQLCIHSNLLWLCILSLFASKWQVFLYVLASTSFWYALTIISIDCQVIPFYAKFPSPTDHYNKCQFLTIEVKMVDSSPQSLWKLWCIKPTVNDKYNCNKLPQMQLQLKLFVLWEEFLLYFLYNLLNQWLDYSHYVENACQVIKFIKYEFYFWFSVNWSHLKPGCGF